MSSGPSAATLSRVSSLVEEKGAAQVTKELEILSVLSGLVSRRVRNHFSKIDDNDDELIKSLANDALDAEFDRQHRKERPIPSGATTVAKVWGWGLGLLAAGVPLNLWLARHLLAGKPSDEGRALREDWGRYADGRILSGKDAYDLGFVDELGTFEDAVKRGCTAVDLVMNVGALKAVP